MDCKQCQSMVFEFFDNLLENEVQASVQAHLDHCQECNKIYMEESSLAKLINDSLLRMATGIQKPFFLKSKPRLKLSWAIAASVLLMVSLLTVYFSVWLPKKNEREQLQFMLVSRAEHFTANPVDNWIDGRLEMVVIDTDNEKDIIRKTYTVPFSKLKKKKEPKDQTNGG